MVQTRSASGMTPARVPPTTPTPAATRRSAPGATASGGYGHVPSQLTLLWLAVAVPLVTWDTLYVLLRPRSMPGGSLHWPLFVPYALYGRVDHMYGAKQWDAGNGFTAAQTLLNVIETAMYIAYVYLWYSRSAPPPPARGAKFTAAHTVGGRVGATALLVGFSAAVMTVSKTLLYCEYTATCPTGRTARDPGAGC